MGEWILENQCVSTCPSLHCFPSLINQKEGFRPQFYYFCKYSLKNSSKFLK
nr:MAG TPA: TEP1 N-terminal domain [Caudoviricetes sp.]